MSHVRSAALGFIIMYWIIQYFSQVVTRLIHLLGQKILQQVNGPLTGVCIYNVWVGFSC